MMSFTVNKVISGCRLGLMESVGDAEKGTGDNIQVDTPACMLYTRAGSVPNLTRDMLDKLENPPKIVHMPLPLLVDHHEAVKEFGKGLKKFTAMDRYLLYCSLQDPAVSCPEGYNDKSGVSVWGRPGRIKVNVELFTKVIDTFQPDLCQVLADTDTNEQSSKKRLCKSRDRTENFLSSCMEWKNSRTDVKWPLMLGTSTGGYDKDERIKSANQLQSLKTDGTVFEGFHNFGPETENFEFNRVKDILSAVIEISKAGPSKPHIWSGIMSPINVLHAVEAGIDLIDSSFPHIVTSRGAALVFKYDVTHNISQSGDISHSTDTEINLKDKKYAEDLSPISTTCTCYTCKRHTRSYISHLLNTSEILAGVLLNMHNFHHYFRFFEALRKSLKENMYSEFRTLIDQQYKCSS